MPLHAATESPEATLERVARGDRDALVVLYDRYGPLLLGVAMRVVGNRSEGEDVVQDAFTRAWREASSFDRARGSAVAWLITLTRNRAIDVVRQRRRRVVREDTAEREADIAVLGEAPASPEKMLVEAERSAAVRLALETLRDEQRRVLELAYFSGLSHSEIAERLGQPLGTVKTRIAQSVKRLREELARFGPQPTDDELPVGDA